MTINYINTGSGANAGNGDTLRLAFTKINSNFSELSNQIDAIEVESTSTLVAGTYTFTLSNTGTISLNGAPFVSGAGATGATGPQGAGFSNLTSTSTNTISTGTQTFVVNQIQGVESAFMGGQYVLAYAGATDNVLGGVYGQILYYYDNIVIFNGYEVLFGAGSTSSWYFELTGAKGIDGTIGINGATGPAGPTNTATTATLGGIIVGHNLAVTAEGTLSSITSVISDVAPANPVEGDQWWDSNLGRGFVYYNGLWIEMSPNVGAVGPAGAIGPTGATGATGNIGATGATGAQGATGAGATGATGAGATGATGQVGATGLQGATGATGYQGTTGATGPQGISLVLVGSTDTVTTSTVGIGEVGQGWINTTNGDVYFWNTLTTLWENIGPIVGPQGGPGPNGATGMYGATGATGPQGDIGATGFTGNDGATGMYGATGATGPQGDIGATGAAGNDGATGAVGNDGATGAAGGNANTGNFVFTASQMSVTNDGDITVVTNANTWTFANDGSLSIPGPINTSGTLVVNSLNVGFGGGFMFYNTATNEVTHNPYVPLGAVQGPMQTLNSVTTGTNTFDCDTGHIFYVTAPESNWTVNFINANNFYPDQVIATSIIIEQGNTAYLPTAVQVEGNATTLVWLNNILPTGTADRTNLVSYRIICTATNSYKVLATLQSY